MPSIVAVEDEGSKDWVEDYRIGGKTATSQTLPRSVHQYISSFIDFTPADDPQDYFLIFLTILNIINMKWRYFIVIMIRRWLHDTD